MTNKKKELKYQTNDRVARWNYIQLISKFIFESGIPDDELRIICLEIQGGDHQLILNVRGK